MPCEAMAHSPSKYCETIYQTYITCLGTLWDKSLLVGYKNMQSVDYISTAKHVRFQGNVTDDIIYYPFWMSVGQIFLVQT